MAKALASHPALGAWEIVNEYEGSLRVPETNANKCFDTNVLQVIHSQLSTNFGELGSQLENRR